MSQGDTDQDIDRLIKSIADDQPPQLLNSFVSTKTNHRYLKDFSLGRSSLLENSIEAMVLSIKVKLGKKLPSRVNFLSQSISLRRSGLFTSEKKNEWLDFQCVS